MYVNYAALNRHRVAVQTVQTKPTDDYPKRSASLACERAIPKPIPTHPSLPMYLPSTYPTGVDGPAQAKQQISVNHTTRCLSALQIGQAYKGKYNCQIPRGQGISGASGELRDTWKVDLVV